MENFFNYINQLMQDEKTKNKNLKKEDFGQYFYNEHFKKNNIRFPRLKFQEFMDNLFPKVVIETVENITLENYINMIKKNEKFFYSKYNKEKIYEDNKISYINPKFDYSKMSYSLRFYKNFNYYDLELEQNNKLKKQNNKLKKKNDKLPDIEKINYEKIKNEFYNTNTTLLSNDEEEDRHTKSYNEYIEHNVYATILTYIKEDNDDNYDKIKAMHKYIYDEIFSKYHLKHNHFKHHKLIHLGIPLLGRFITKELYQPEPETNSQPEKTKTRGGNNNKKKKQEGNDNIQYYNTHHYSNDLINKSPQLVHFLLNFLLDHDSIIITKKKKQKINFELFLIFLCYLKMNKIINTTNIKNIFDSKDIIKEIKSLLKAEGKIYIFYNDKIFNKLPEQKQIKPSDNLYSKLDENGKFDYILFILFIIFYVFFIFDKGINKTEHKFATILKNTLIMDVKQIKLLNLLFPVTNNSDKNSQFNFIIDEKATINRRLPQSRDLIYNLNNNIEINDSKK